METVSLWHSVADAKKSEKFPSLSEKIDVDVAIIGVGITGLTTATYLIDAGKKVAVLEAYTIGSGTTGNSTGNLYIETQPFFKILLKNLI